MGKIMILVLIAIVLIVIVGTIIFRHEIADFLHRRKMSDRQKEMDYEIKRLERELENMPNNLMFGLQREELLGEINRLKKEMEMERNK